MSAQSPNNNVNNDNVIRPTQFIPSGQHSEPVKTKFNLWKVLVVVLLVAAGIVIWFLLSAKSLMVVTTPHTEQISIESALAVKVKQNFLLLPGSHELNAQLSGYYPVTQSISVTEAQNQSLSIEFKPLPGALTVNVQQDIVATVFIAGKIVGQTGQMIADIPAGEHVISVNAARYQPYQGTINIEGKLTEQQLAIELLPDWASVNLTSDPAGANVISNGQHVGVTPMQAELLSGNTVLQLTLPGYKPWQKTLTLKALQVIDVEPVKLQKLDGELSVTSTPAGASVTIDNEYMGLTPLSISVAPDKNYQISLFKDGYQISQQQAFVGSNTAKKLAVDLQPLLASVRIQSNPSDALLYVDDILMGRASQTVTLTAKQHEVRIEKAGYVTHIQTFIPKLDLNQQLDITLKTEAQARWENTPLAITTKSGIELKMFNPTDAQFTMGASRREQGRRANEAQRNIKLTKPFYISLQEVTNLQYRQFAKQHSSGHVNGNSLNSDNYPAVRVSWQQAALYCNWLSQQHNLAPFYLVENGQIIGFSPDSVGYRLPLESEWAWLSRFHNKPNTKYAWGDGLPPNAIAGNIADRSGAPILGQIQAQYDDKFIVSAPVGSFQVDENGLFDLSGNVAEWVHDYYEIKTGLSLTAELDPVGPVEGQFHVIRGTSWRHGSMTELRQAFRDYGDSGRDDVGFRVARFVEK